MNMVNKPMAYYFKLQYTMLRRKLSVMNNYADPWVDYSLALFFAFVFIGLSLFLLSSGDYAGYIYALISLATTTMLSDARRNDFLKICFGKDEYIRLRIVENLILVSPFVLFLIIKLQFVPMIILLVLSVCIVWVDVKKSYSFVIPTPFYKRPFEFTVGFRVTFLFIVFAYFLTVMAVRVDNFNLGAFSMIAILLLVSCYHVYPEKEYFVWIYGFTPLEFIMEKLKTAYIYTFLLCLPIVLLLTVCYITQVGVLLLFLLLGYLYLTAVILVKYSAYPNDMDLKDGAILFLCLFVQPFLLVVIPVYAKRAMKQMRGLLV